MLLKANQLGGSTGNPVNGFLEDQTAASLYEFALIASLIAVIALIMLVALSLTS